MDTNATPAPVPQHSETVQLVIDIELSTGSSWTQEQRAVVAEMVRKYRFNQVGSVLLRVQALVRESGNIELSEKVYTGKF
jgi:hypothetical protein